MKILKKITLWVVISLIIQTSIFYFIDKDLRSYKIDIEDLNEGKQQNNKLDIVKIPQKAQMINISNSGKYLSYGTYEYFYTVNTHNSKSNKVFLGKDYVLDSYEWLINIERAIIVKKKVDKYGQYEYMLSYYDADNNVFKDISHITWGDELSSVKDIIVSQITGLVYVEINSQNVIDTYSIDTMGRIEKVNLGVNYIKNIDILEHSGNLIFQDKHNKIFIKLSNDLKNVFSDYKNFEFIGTDMDDNIYLANVEHGEANYILYGNIEKQKLKNIKFNESYKVDDIILSKNGQIYINKKNSNTILHINSGNEIKYNGNFLNIYKSGIISLLNNKVIKNYFK